MDEKVADNFFSSGSAKQLPLKDEEENSESLAPARPKVTLAEILIASLL